MRMIGVLGGMGPPATAAFYSRVIQLFQQQRCAVANSDFPEMLVHSIPSPDNVGIREDPRMLEVLSRSVDLLDAAGVDFIVIPCNTVHVHLDALRARARASIVSLIDSVVEVVSQSPIRCAYVLGTRRTITAGLYSRAFEAVGIATRYPSETEQQRLGEIILAVNAGRCSAADAESLSDLLASDADDQCAILACTELSLVPISRRVSLVDSLEVLARKTFALALGG